MLHIQSQLPALVLASSSPQRRRLLEQAGFEFTVQTVPYEEDHTQGQNPRELVEILCRHKLQEAGRFLSPAITDTSLVLCSDTMVAIGNQRLGKPADRVQAEDYLRRLSGTTHEVITGIGLQLPPVNRQSKILYADSVTTVTFRALPEADLAWYLDSGEWREAAGAYRMQGRAACYIDRLDGSYTGVMGLPLDLLYDMLRQLLD